MKRQSKKRIYRRVDLQKFIRIWQKAKTVQEALKRFGVYKSTLEMSATATRLRRKGVKLKQYPRGWAQSHDYKALAKLASEAGK